MYFTINPFRIYEEHKRRKQDTRHRKLAEIKESLYLIELSVVDPVSYNNYMNYLNSAPDLTDLADIMSSNSLFDNRIMNLSTLGLVSPNEEIIKIANTMIKLAEEDLCAALANYEKEFRIKSQR